MHATQVVRFNSESESAEGMDAGREGASIHALFHDKRHLLHKRMERWIRLQQFVYGLPEDYSYAIRVTDDLSGAHCTTFVRMGWMTWFGRARGTDRQHALALSLMETSEAICNSPQKMFLHIFRRSLRFAWAGFWKRRATLLVSDETEELKAG